MKFWNACALVACLVSAGLAQTRMISHVARNGSGFDSQVVIFNSTQQSAVYSLNPFMTDGTALATVSRTIEPLQEIRIATPDLFSSTEVSHFSITSDAGVSLAIEYDPVAWGISTRIWESTVQARQWHLFPGDWSSVFDGIAVVNTGNTTTNVVVNQTDSTGNLVDTQVLIQELAPSAKGLAILADYFDWIEGSRFEIIAQQPLALTSLSGYQDSGLFTLWENATLVFETGKWRSDGPDVFQQGGRVENRMLDGQRIVLGNAFDLLQSYPSYPNWSDSYASLQNNPGMAALDNMGNLRAWMGQLAIGTEGQNTGTIYTLGHNGSRNFAVGSTGSIGGYIGVYNGESNEEASLFSATGGKLRLRYDGSTMVFIKGLEGGGSMEILNGESQTKVFLGIDEEGNGILEVDGAFTSKTRHPETASQIRYTALSGGEKGIYHRGKVSLVEGRATISLPDHFKALASLPSITVSLTPASFSSKGLAVGSVDLNGIEIGELDEGKGNYQVHYLVHALRKGSEAYKAMVPMKSNKAEPEHENPEL